ncbi:hypothetical protein DXG01_002085 [Tephrocybe rancida]|nr:hypothetical protein DXG01_002085 [Tephrocybe rancida]
MSNVGTLECNRIIASIATIVGRIAQPPLPPPRPNINNSSSSVASQAKRPREDKKANPFVDLEAEEDQWENADILDDTEGEDEFNDFIDNHEVVSDEEPTSHSLIDKAEEDAQRDGEVPGEEDEDLDDEEYNEYPPTAAAISHKALASHNDMEQW